MSLENPEKSPAEEVQTPEEETGVAGKRNPNFNKKEFDEANERMVRELEKETERLSKLDPNDLRNAW